METSIYDSVLQQARQLSPDEQLRLLEDVISLLRHRTKTPTRRRSIMELRGLGKEIWRDVDAQNYVDQERSSWDG